MKEYWGRGGITSHILNLGTRWRWVGDSSRVHIFSKRIFCVSYWPWCSFTSDTSLLLQS